MRTVETIFTKGEEYREQVGGFDGLMPLPAATDDEGLFTRTHNVCALSGHSVALGNDYDHQSVWQAVLPGISWPYLLNPAVRPLSS